jgi:hypothetical protein
MSTLGCVAGGGTQSATETAQQIHICINSIACYAVHETATREDQCVLVPNTSEHAQCMSSPNADKMLRILDAHIQQ